MDSTFFFLLFLSYPNRKRVKIYADGAKSAFFLTHDEFEKLIFDATGSYELLPEIRNVLSTWGTPWLYDRTQNKIIKISASKNIEDTIQMYISSALSQETESARTTINPAEDLALADLKMPFEDFKMTGDLKATKIKTNNGISISVKK